MIVPLQTCGMRCCQANADIVVEQGLAYRGAGLRSANAAQRALGQVKFLLDSETSMQKDTDVKDSAGASGTSASDDDQDDDARTKDSTSVKAGDDSEDSSHSSQEGGDAHVGVEGRVDAGTNVRL